MPFSCGIASVCACESLCGPVHLNQLVLQKALCRSAEDRLDIKKACQASCRKACGDSLEEYRISSDRESGLPPSKQSLERPGRSCARSCAYECQKEGSGYKFTVNSNR